MLEKEGLKILFLTDMNDGLDNLRAEYLEDEDFKNYKSKAITSHNIEQEDTQKAINRYAKGILDTDILFASPSLNIGIRLNGLFDVVVIDTSNNKHTPFTSHEIKQMMTRDADCQHIVWQRPDKRDRKPKDRLSNKPINWKIKAPADWNNISEKEWVHLSEILGKIKIKHTEFRELNPLTGVMQTKDSWVIKRYVEMHNYSRKDRQKLDKNVKKDVKKHGATWLNFEKTLALLPEEEKVHKKITSRSKAEDIRKACIGEISHNVISLEKVDMISQALGIELNPEQTITEEQWNQYDEGHYLENKQRRSQLDDCDNLSDLEKKPGGSHQITKELLQLAWSFSKMKILTNEQFKTSKAYKYLKKHHYLFQHLAEKQFHIYKPKITETDISALEFMAQILKKYNYKTTIKREAETNPNAERKHLYKDAMKEHKKEFTRWKQLAPKPETGYVKYDDWIWEMLNRKENIRFGRKTRQYIKTFPHMLIEDYSGVNTEETSSRC